MYVLKRRAARPRGRLLRRSARVARGRDCAASSSRPRRCEGTRSDLRRRLVPAHRRAHLANRCDQAFALISSVRRFRDAPESCCRLRRAHSRVAAAQPPAPASGASPQVHHPMSSAAERVTRRTAPHIADPHAAAGRGRQSTLGSGFSSTADGLAITTPRGVAVREATAQHRIEYLGPVRRGAGRSSCRHRRGARPRVVKLDFFARDCPTSLRRARSRGACRRASASPPWAPLASDHIVRGT